MKRVEQDASERHRRKKEDEAKADDLKKRGNEYFKNGDFQTAIKFYTQAITFVNDNPLLFTNRAQVRAVAVRF